MNALTKNEIGIIAGGVNKCECFGLTPKDSNFNLEAEVITTPKGDKIPLDYNMCESMCCNLPSSLVRIKGAGSWRFNRGEISFCKKEKNHNLIIKHNLCRQGSLHTINYLIFSIVSILIPILSVTTLLFGLSLA